MNLVSSVCASRYVYGGSIGGCIKKNLSYFAGKSLFYLTTLPINDPTNSFNYILEKDQIKFNDSQGGFEIGIEIVAKFHNLG